MERAVLIAMIPIAAVGRADGHVGREIHPTTLLVRPMLAQRRQDTAELRRSRIDLRSWALDDPVFHSNSEYEYFSRTSLDDNLSRAWQLPACCLSRESK